MVSLWFCLGFSAARQSEPVRSPSWVPQPVRFAWFFVVLLLRPDPDRHPPVEVPKADLLLCLFLPICGLWQLDLPVSSGAACCPQAFSILISSRFCAMSRIGGLHPLRQLARLTGASGAADPNSSGSGPAAAGAPTVAPVAQPSDGVAATAPAPAGGDGSAGPVAAAPGPANDGTDGDGGSAPPAPILKSSGAAFLAPAPGPTPKTPPAKVSAAPPARSSLSSGIDIRDPSYRPSFPKASAGSGDGGAASSAPAASGSGPQPAPADPDSVDFSELITFSDDAIYAGLANIPVSHLVRLSQLISEVTADQFYAIFNLTQLDIETPTGQLHAAGPPPLRGQYPPDHRSNLRGVPDGPRFPDRTGADTVHRALDANAAPSFAQTRPPALTDTSSIPPGTPIVHSDPNREDEDPEFDPAAQLTPRRAASGPWCRSEGWKRLCIYLPAAPGPLIRTDAWPYPDLFCLKSAICRPGCPGRHRPRHSTTSPSVAIAPTTVRPEARAV